MFEVDSRNIFIGDILKLNYGQMCPCDVLILATSEDINGKYICWLDSLYDDGKCARDRKDAIALTKSFAHWANEDRGLTYFLNRLNGKIVYKSNQDQITGSLKIKDDPKIEVFDDSKIIKRGCVMRSKYALGLVLYNGKGCYRTDKNWFSF